MSPSFNNIFFPILASFAGGVLIYLQARMSKRQGEIHQDVRQAKQPPKEIIRELAEIKTQMGFLHAEKQEAHRELFGQVTRISAQLSAHIEQDRQGFVDIERALTALNATVIENRERIKGLEARTGDLEH